MTNKIFACMITLIAAFIGATIGAAMNFESLGAIFSVVTMGVCILDAIEKKS